MSEDLKPCRDAFEELCREEYPANDPDELECMWPAYEAGAARNRRRGETEIDSMRAATILHDAELDMLRTRADAKAYHALLAEVEQVRDEMRGVRGGQGVCPLRNWTDAEQALTRILDKHEKEDFDESK